MAKGREWARGWVRAGLGRILEQLPEKARLPTSETLARQWRVRADIVAEVYAEVAAAGRAEFIEGVGYVKSSGSVIDVEEPDNAVRSVDLPDDHPASKLAAARAAILTQRTRAGLGAHLPTEWEIAEAAGVSRQTAREAFVELAEEGLVRKGAPGQGWLAVRSATSGTELPLARSAADLKDRVRGFVVDAPPGTSVSARWVARTFRVSNRLADRVMHELAEETHPQVETLQRGEGLEYRTVGGPARAPTRHDVKERLRDVARSLPPHTPFNLREMADECGTSIDTARRALRELAAEPTPLFESGGSGTRPDSGWRTAGQPGEPAPSTGRVSESERDEAADRLRRDEPSWADAVDDLTRRPPADRAAELPEWDDFGPPEASDVDEIADPGSKTRAPDRIEEPAEAIEEPAAHADGIEQRLGEPVTLDDPDDLDGPG